MFANFVDSANVRVIQCRCNASLTPEAFESLMVFRKVIGKKFQGNETAKFGVLSLVHHTHPATAELFEYAVVRDCLTNKGLRLHRLARILGCDLRQVNESTGYDERKCLQTSQLPLNAEIGKVKY